ncbi:MAG: protoporphyrinogen oxidase [Salinirussus sp.]
MTGDRVVTESPAGRPLVGIVGAGITGLALTQYLADRDVPSVAFEARAEPGGVIQSGTVGGRVVEAGPQRMRATPAVRSLIETAGLDDEVIEAPDGPVYVYADGRLREAPTSARAFLRTDLLSWPAKLRLLAEPLTRPGTGSESVAELCTRKFGRQAYERVIGPLYGGLYGSDPAEMPAAFALEGLLDREAETGSLLTAFRDRIAGSAGAPPVSFESGLQRLPETLADAHSDRINLETPVTDVDAAGEGYRIEAAGESATVDEAVITAPADTAADLLAGLATGTDALAGLRYNPLALVYLRAAREPDDRGGLGYQVSYDEELHTLGVSFNGVMFGRDGLCTAFLGGMHEPDLVGASDDRLGRIASREFERATGCAAEVLGVDRRDRWFPAYDHTWWGLEEFDTPPGVHLATNYTGRLGIPSRIREARELAADLGDRLG